MSRVHRLRRRRRASRPAPTTAPASLAAERLDGPLEPAEAALAGRPSRRLRRVPRGRRAHYEADRLAAARPARPAAGAAARPVGPDVGRHRTRSRPPAAARRDARPAAVTAGCPRSACCPAWRSSRSSSARPCCPAGSSPAADDGRRPAGELRRRSPSPADGARRPARRRSPSVPGSVGWVGTGVGRRPRLQRHRRSTRSARRSASPTAPPVADRDSKPVDIAIRPKSISQSPVQNQAVVVGTDAAGDDAVLVIAAADRRTDARLADRDRDRHRLRADRRRPAADRRRPTPEPTSPPARPSPTAAGDAVGRAAPPSRRAAGRRPSVDRRRRPSAATPRDRDRRHRRRRVGRVLARRRVVRVHRSPVRRLGRAGHLRLARRRREGPGR